MKSCLSSVQELLAVGNHVEVEGELLAVELKRLLVVLNILFHVSAFIE